LLVVVMLAAITSAGLRAAIAMGMLVYLFVEMLVESERNQERAECFEMAEF
jgi:hypothetical protein